MAAASLAELEDPLFNLRRAIHAGTAPILTTTADPTSASDTVDDLAQATHIQFNADDIHKTFDLSMQTRFAPGDQPVTLRSIYFTWLNKDATLPDYISAVQRLNEELPSGAGGSVQNLTFAHKVDLIGWLSGELDVSEYTAPLEGATAAEKAEGAARVASGVTGPAVQDGAIGAVRTAQTDARLLQIYEDERRMGDRNSVLRGSKPTDFSAYRTIAQKSFLTRKPTAPVPNPHQPLVSNLKKPSRTRLEPIILLSPSASSLLRMSNIKKFLDEGLFVPPNAIDATSANLLHLNRNLPSIDAKDLRFIIVDSTTNFKPTYWPRVVAIFTTGQPWQFKSYRYTNPVELFSHYPGVYVGYHGEEVPDIVKGWGRNVLTLKVDKWSGSTQGRWRDREVVETLWGRIEEGMRRSGWTRDGPGAAATGGR